MPRIDIYFVCASFKYWIFCPLFYYNLWYINVNRFCCIPFISILFILILEIKES